MARVGYARVSSVGQSLNVQLDKLRDCDKIFQEKRSGVSYQRPRLKACLEYVRDGDTLVVTRLDRLARSTLHLCQVAEQLDRNKCIFRCLTRISIRLMRRGDCCLMSSERLPSSRLKSGLSVKWMGLKMPEPVESVLDAIVS
ncbi:resolvase, N-terminal domain truncation (plasmid) [Acaryochloris marina MBIC11017]|uniref:Resolvase, N-terminal domain truncation n=1 Tax=Acaryochloris marina (strain MBIC 11017) TaxID=329726 RepID=A8ZMY3_ACAM1|nr:resolvase, N-terminal domain truncation [Acaryochloris marina MBIC11017]